MEPVGLLFSVEKRFKFLEKPTYELETFCYHKQIATDNSCTTGSEITES